MEKTNWLEKWQEENSQLGNALASEPMTEEETSRLLRRDAAALELAKVCEKFDTNMPEVNYRGSVSYTELTYQLAQALEKLRIVLEDKP